MAIQLGRPAPEQALSLGLSQPALNKPAFGANLVSSQADSVRFGAVAMPLLRKQGNVTHIVTFGALNDPILKQPPALQMKVRGVTRNQGPYGTAIGPIGELAAADWKDGLKLDFSIAGRNRIKLSAPGYGPLGEVPPEIADNIINVLRQRPQEFRFELSNMIAGTTKGAPTIGLRVNLVYVGKNGAMARQARQAFSFVLNSPECKDSAMLYQAATSPDQVLNLILKHEELTKNKAAADQMSKIIDNITAKIKDPGNKRILLLGHCKPDGDTLGCVVGLKNAIELMDPSRKVDCAVDDRIPGLFRDKVPGIDSIKHPNNPAKLQEIDQMLADLNHKLQNPTGLPQDKPELVKGRIAALQQEKKILSDPSNLLNANDKYDLVITMDIPTPSRFTDKFKPYLSTAKDVVYIDHHPHRFNEWDAAKNTTGLDMAQVHQKGLAWVADSVGACAEMMTVIGNKLVPQMAQVAKGTPLAQVFPKTEQQQKLARYVAGLVTGMCTDTGSFTRTANLTPEDMNKPVEERPNFQPEGVAKWLMQLTEASQGNRIDKKWLRENVTYGVSDKAHELMSDFATTGTKDYPNVGFGVIQVDYNQMNAVWQTAMEQDGAVNLLDVQNEFKYSENMGQLKGDPRARGNQGKAAGPYDADKIAVLICQDKKKGELDEKLEVAQDNGLRLSLRSGNGTEHAELLASLFGGGGHGAASGARIDLPGIELNTPLAIQINGQVSNDPAAALKILRANMAVNHNSQLTDDQKKQMTTPISVVENAAGKPAADLLADLVGAIRQEQGNTGGQNQRRTA